MIHCYWFLYNTQHFLAHMNHHVSLEMKWKHKFPSSLSRVCLVVYTWNPKGRNIAPIYRELGTMEYANFIFSWKRWRVEETTRFNNWVVFYLLDYYYRLPQDSIQRASYVCLCRIELVCRNQFAAIRVLTYQYFTHLICSICDFWVWNLGGFGLVTCWCHRSIY